MRIGRLPNYAGVIETGKWYIGLELLPRPRGIIRCFRPFLILVCYKVIDPGDQGRKINGRKPVTRGGYWAFQSPITIEAYFSISRSPRLSR